MPGESFDERVKKTVSSHITGEECPVPGRSKVHLISFFVMVLGIALSDECPEVPGPRNWVHSFPNE